MIAHNFYVLWGHSPVRGFLPMLLSSTDAFIWNIR
jgi:hypothetical protein